MERLTVDPPVSDSSFSGTAWTKAIVEEEQRDDSYCQLRALSGRMCLDISGEYPLAGGPVIG